MWDTDIQCTSKNCVNLYSNIVLKNVLKKAQTEEKGEPCKKKQYVFFVQGSKTQV